MKKITWLLIIAVLLFNCTDLKEELNDTVTADVAARTADPQSVLESAYQAVRPFNTQDNIYVCQSHTTDEMAGPTRGADWDDAGIWRVLHTHNWTNSHSFIASGYTALLSGVFKSTQVLEFEPNAQQAAEAKFLRAFFAFHAVDNFGLVLGREPGENLTDPPSITLKRAAGIDFVIDELESIAGIEIYIATKITTKNLYSATEKYQWIEEHFPTLLKNMFITCDKALLKGDFLIDDYHKWKTFQGDFIHFNKHNPLDAWEEAVKRIRDAVQ